MKNFKKIADINITEARNLLGCLPALWTQETFRQDHPLSPHRATETIYLRWPPAMTAYAALYAQDFEDKPALVHKPFRRLLEEVEKTLDKPALRAIFVRLAPRGHIGPHIDQGPFADSTDRYHLGISCPDNCTFFVEDEPKIIQNGELYWFNKQKMHRVVSKSPAPRIHMIVDTAK